MTVGPTFLFGNLVLTDWIGLDQWTAHALGIRHFTIQHDISFTAPNLPTVAYPEGFQGTSITVVGKFVADLIEDRLAGKI